MIDEARRPTTIQIKADEKVLRAITSLEGNEDFRVIVDWLTNSMFSISLAVSLDIVLPERAHFIGQGKVIALHELKELFKSAREILRMKDHAKARVQ